MSRRSSDARGISTSTQRHRAVFWFLADVKTTGVPAKERLSSIVVPGITRRAALLEVEPETRVRTRMGLIDGLVVVLRRVAVSAVTTVDVERRTREVHVHAEVVLDDVVRHLERLVERRAVRISVEPRAVRVRVVIRRTEPAPALIERRQLLEAGADGVQGRISVVVRRLQVADADVQIRIRADRVLEPTVERRLDGTERVDRGRSAVDRLERR